LFLNSANSKAVTAGRKNSEILEGKAFKRKAEYDPKGAVSHARKT
jgi:hypothetical protein